MLLYNPVLMSAIPSNEKNGTHAHRLLKIVAAYNVRSKACRDNAWFSIACLVCQKIVHFIPVLGKNIRAIKLSSAVLRM